MPCGGVRGRGSNNSGGEDDGDDNDNQRNSNRFATQAEGEDGTSI